MRTLLLNLRIGFFLAYRQIRRANLWTTSLIVFVMFLTFLNLVGVTGLLVGLTTSIVKAYQEQYTGDVFISTLDSKSSIEHSPQIIAFVRSLPGVEVVDPRVVAGASLEARYKEVTDQSAKSTAVSGTMVGIDPVAGDEFARLSEYVVAGSYLAPGDYDQILVGGQLIEEYSFAGPGAGDGTRLTRVGPGTLLRMTINGVSRDVYVKGIVNSRGGNIGDRIYMNAEQLYALTDTQDFGVQEIGIRLAEGTDAVAIKETILASGVGEYAKVETAEEGVPSGIATITQTFSAIGNLIGSIALVVASITIFIVIFVNALTRRKFIGILQGIGISSRAIEYSYIFQSIFYAVLGSLVGIAVLALLVYVTDLYPIQLPLGDVSIYATPEGTMVRALLLITATVIAGFIPARMIVKKNTLDSILGRN